MARHQVFIVHGMGDFKKDWSEKIQQVIKDNYATYESAAKNRPGEGAGDPAAGAHRTG